MRQYASLSVPMGPICWARSPTMPARSAGAIVVCGIWTSVFMNSFYHRYLIQDITNFIFFKKGIKLTNKLRKLIMRPMILIAVSTGDLSR